jgi:hypothetical protein
MELNNTVQNVDMKLQINDEFALSHENRTVAKITVWLFFIPNSLGLKHSYNPEVPVPYGFEVARDVSNTGPHFE